MSPARLDICHSANGHSSASRDAALWYISTSSATSDLGSCCCCFDAAAGCTPAAARALVLRLVPLLSLSSRPTEAAPPGEDAAAELAVALRGSCSFCERPRLGLTPCALAAAKSGRNKCPGGAAADSQSSTPSSYRTSIRVTNLWVGRVLMVRGRPVLDSGSVEHAATRASNVCLWRYRARTTLSEADVATRSSALRDPFRC